MSVQCSQYFPDDGRTISRNVPWLNILVDDVINLFYYKSINSLLKKSVIQIQIWVFKFKRSRSCEGSGNIIDNITQLLLFYIKSNTTKCLDSTRSNHRACNLWYYVILNLQYLFETLTSLEYYWNTMHRSP